MAQVPYNPVPDVAPRTVAPDDLEHIQATPQSFGGLIAQGLREQSQGEQRLGSEAIQAAKFFGQVSADDQWNQAADKITKMLHGDPNKSIPGPNGQQMPDAATWDWKNAQPSTQDRRSNKTSTAYLKMRVKI